MIASTTFHIEDIPEVGTGEPIHLEKPRSPFILKRIAPIVIDWPELSTGSYNRLIKDGLLRLDDGEKACLARCVEVRMTGFGLTGKFIATGWYVKRV